MDTRRKACPNEQCKTYQKKKYNAKVNYCPECGEKLIYVCKTHECFKPLDETQPKHEYCFACKTKREDRKYQVKQMAKKGVAGVGVAVVVPAKIALQKDVGKLAQQAVHRAVNVAAKAIKK